MLRAPARLRSQNCPRPQARFTHTRPVPTTGTLDRRNRTTKTPGVPKFINKRIMSSFSNADTGSKAADPYKTKNKDEAPVAEKIETLDKFITAAKFGMMTTRDTTTGRLVSRCMALAGKEKGGVDLLFHTNTETNKTDELQGDPHTNIAFLNSSGEWASISGKASIETDREIVKKYYTSSLKAWIGDLGDGKHDGSANDPRIGVIWVKAETATYAVSHRTALGTAYEVAKGAMTGEAAAVNKLREITESEIQQWRSLH